MTPAKGKPGEGKRKLSPSFASSMMVAQIAKLPPAVRKTFSLLILYSGAGNVCAILSRASSLPTNLVYPSILPTLFATI